MKNRTNMLAAALCCLCLGFSLQANATSWRVNNSTKAKADFLDLNAAMQKVSDGDTIYMDKGTVLASSQTISKSVTVIGPGYFIGENDADEAKLSSSLYITADDVKITGLHTSSIYIRALETVIERCRVNGTISGNGNYDNDYASIRACFIEGSIQGNSTSGAAEWEILNNIIYGSSNSYRINYLSEAIICNNILYSYYSSSLYSVISSTTNSTIKNNIISQGSSSYSSYTIENYSVSSNNVISNNILSGFSGSTNHPNNKTNSNITNILNATNGYSKEQYYVLSSNSIAKGYADDGGDCGCWGSGAYPYVMSGYPLHIPRFESMTVPSKPDSNGNLKVTLKVVNQNE